MRSTPFRWRRGTGAATLHTYVKTLRHVYSAPHALLEATLVLVVVDGDEVVGFATGPIDTLLWEDVLERSWWPALRRRYPDPEEASFASWTADQRRASAIHHPERAPRDVVDAYPAHLHLYLLPGAQGRRASD